MKESEQCFVFNQAAGYYRDERLRDDIPWQNQLQDGEEALEYSTYPDQIKEIKEDIDHRYNQDYFVFNHEAGWYCEHIRFGMAPGISFLDQVANWFSPHADILSYEKDRDQIEAIKTDIDQNRN